MTSGNPAEDLQIRLLATDAASLEAIARPWDDLYLRDPEANFFLSRPFLEAVFNHKGPLTRLLAVFRQDRLLGLLPLRLRCEWAGGKGEFFTELGLPGGIWWADYTGFLVDPEGEAETLAALAKGAKRIRWGMFPLKNLRASPERRDHFLSAFAEPDFRIKRETSHANDGETDNLVCPRMTLPEDFETYLAGLSRNTRQKLRRLLRSVEAGEFAVRAGGNHDIERVAELWKERWGHRKGSRIDGLMSTCHDILGEGMSRDILRVHVLEKEGKLIAAIANFEDRTKREVLFFLAARDQNFEGSNPGLILQAHAIREAIAGGFKVYDFLRGDEPYKFQLGGLAETIDFPVIARNPKHGSQLDPISFPALLRQIPAMIQGDEADKARVAALQVAYGLETPPDREI